MINEDFSSRGKFQDIGRWYITDYVYKIARTIPKESSVLDAGAGECVYRKFFTHCNYKSLDLGVGENKWNYANIDYIGPIHDMPIRSNMFDVVLCTQVLEHLEWPRESVKEIYRVLKPGGKLYLTAPMSHCEHQIPYDYFRYTSYGLNSIFERAGFKEIKVKPFGGLWVRWAYELPRSLSIFPALRSADKHISFLGGILFPSKLIALLVIRFLQCIFLFLDKYDQDKNDPFGWSCEATK